MTAAFKNGPVEIRWRDVRVRWRNERELWPPSVDSFAFMQDLEGEGVFQSDCRNILDLGSGTGFLGIALAKLNPNVDRLTLADWLLTPALFGAVNWGLNKKGRERVDLSLRIGMFSDWLIEEPSASLEDVALCNPPYLPLLPGFEQFGIHTVVAGTDLLSHVIENAASLGRRVYVQFSHLAKKDADETAITNKMTLVALKSTPRMVPFRVRRAWTEMPDYFQALKEMNDGLITKPRARHPYWHLIQTYEVKAQLR